MFGKCLTDYGGGEPCEYLTLTHTAQCGGYKCRECHDEIREGQQHELVVACYEGDWKVIVTCTRCVRIRDSVFSHGEFVHGRLWKRIHEAYGLTKDGIDEEWVPLDRRASGVIVDTEYERELEEKLGR